MMIQPVSAPTYPIPVTPVAPIAAKVLAPSSSGDGDGDVDSAAVAPKAASGTGTLVDIRV